MNVPRDDSAVTSPAPGLSGFLARVARRLAWIAAAEGAALGLGVAALIAAAAWWGRGRVMQTAIAGVVLAALGIALRIHLSSRRRESIAGLVERRVPQSRNVIVTAAELIDRPAPVRPDVRARLFREADRIVGGLDAARLFPARRAIAAFSTGALLWAGALILVSARPVLSSSSPDARADVPVDALSIDGIEIVVTPPSYTGRPAQMLRDPARLEALAGSRVQLVVRAIAARVVLETIAGRDTLAATEGRSFRGDLVADADGFIAVEAAASDGRPGARRLIGLTVTPDRAPRVRITAPGRDLFLPEARGAIDLAVEADDDLALASLRLRYTKVSGSGERFTFTEGEAPLTISRATSQAWTARGALPIPALALVAGDVVVYRAIAADRRPGAVPTESDAFIVEITAPGAVPSEGFAADDELDRNAVSQQMVILKTERLLARRSSIGSEAFAEEARTIAAEQRRVRAEFVFMMGGELAEEVAPDATGISELNEEEEAEASDDILAGRLANRGRVELVRAIRAMSEANAKLGDMDVPGALKDEVRALEHLQNAFSRTRYLLRTLTLRERLDLTRRLTGALADAGRDLRPIPESAADPRTASLRDALAGIATLSAAGPSDGAGTASLPPRASILAQDVLRVDPSDERLQGVATRLTEAGDAIARGRPEEARGLLDRAALDLATVIRAALVDAPRSAPSLDLRRLEGALGDALRRPGGDR